MAYLNKPELSPSVSRVDVSSRLDEFILGIWARKWLILLCVILGMAAGLIISKVATKTYEAVVVLAPAHAERANPSLRALSSQFSDLAGMFGVALPGGDTGSASLNIAYLKSRQFATNFIRQYDLLPALFANRWDARNKQWRNAGSEREPTMEDAVRFFQKGVMTLREDRKAGTVSLSVQWRDRRMAAQWANQIVADVNDQARQRAILEAQNSLKYLSAELEKTSIVGLRDAIYRLMENNIDSIMLANVRRNFAFEVVDPATVPDVDHYVHPVPILDLAVGCLIGGLLGVLSVPLLGRRRSAPI